MDTTETTKLQAALERALVALEAGDAHAAERAVRAALQETGAVQMLTPAQAARWLGVDSHYAVLGFIKSGFLPFVRDEDQIYLPFADLQQIDDHPDVALIRRLDALHREIGDFGVPDGLTEEYLEMLSATRPGTYPWQRDASRNDAA